MKKEKDLEKLNQLDRIEYRQVYQMIIDNTEMGLFVYSVYFTFWLLVIIYAYILLLSQINLSVANALTKGFLMNSFLSIILGGFILFGFIFDLLNFIKREKMLNKLNKKFFGLE